LPDGRVLFAMNGGIYAANAYASGDDFVALVDGELEAVHPTGGAGFSRPPLSASVRVQHSVPLAP
jgi:hypothetical protein